MILIIKQFKGEGSIKDSSKLMFTIKTINGSSVGLCDGDIYVNFTEFTTATQFMWRNQ